jgi:hypothetical protein
MLLRPCAIMFRSLVLQDLRQDLVKRFHAQLLRAPPVTRHCAIWFNVKVGK